MTTENESTQPAGEQSPADSITDELPGMEHTRPPAPTPKIEAPKPPKRKRGRPRKSTSAPRFEDIERASKKPLPGEEIPPDPNATVSGAESEAGGPGITSAAAVTVENITCETIIGIIQILLVFVGEEEGVLTKTEKTLLRPGLERLLRKYEIGETALPPELEVLLAVAGIVIERVKKGGKTATAFAKFKAWTAGMWSRHKGAQVGSQLRREVPTDLVSKLADKVTRLEHELMQARASKPAPATQPSTDAIPDPGAPVKQ